MHRLFLLGILGIAGCQNVVGPLEYRRPVRVDDPQLPIPLQEKLGRSEFAVPYDSREVAPKTDTNPPNFYQP